MSAPGNSELNDEQQLILRTADGDSYAFSRIYEHYKKRVFHLSMTYLQDSQDAVEITQQVFIRLWERRARLSGVNSLKDYILAIARNAIFDYLKQLGRQARLVSAMKGAPLPSSADSGELMEEKFLTGIWLEITGRLPERQKQVYQLIELEGMDLERVTEITQLSKATVKKHLELSRRYVRTEMRKQLANRGIFDGFSGSLLLNLLFF